MPPSLDDVKRKAAGHVMLVLFHLVSSSVVHPLKIMASKSNSGLGSGLTDKERELVLKMSTELFEKAELMRRLGWRFEGRR